jgi:1,5-anhydro-D-fructose reductase (1,5-anhydro-D-mannitol-forming)
LAGGCLFDTVLPMQTIRWGIIGCGDVTEIKSGPGFQKAQGSALVAVMRRDAAKAADYARRHGVAKWYDDGQKLIDDPEVDAVYVATPPGMHEAYAMQACAAGKPCYVEKPMARNAAEVRRMVDAFAKRKVPLFVAFYRRGMPKFVKAKQIIESGALGPLRSVSYEYRDSQMVKRIDPMPWRLSPEQAGGGLFLDLGAHVLDILDFMIAPLQQIKGEARNRLKRYPIEDQVDLTATMRGVPLTVSFDFTAPQPHDRFVIKGDRGELSFSCFGVEPLVLQISGKEAEAVEFVTPAHVQQPLIQGIIDLLRGDDRPGKWVSTGDVGLRTQLAMDLALQSYYGGREDGFWTRFGEHKVEK